MSVIDEGLEPGTNAEEQQQQNNNSNENVDVEVLSIDNKDYNLDKEGNALNEDGTVFKTKAELDNFEEISDSVNIGDTKYTKDKDGNLVNVDGEIVYTAEEAKNIDSETSIVQLMEATGIKPLDANGNRIIYADTKDGHIAYANDIAILKSQADIARSWTNFWNSNSDIKAVFEHKRIYGSIDNYNAKTDYTNIVLDKDNKEQLTNIVIAARTMHGESADSAKRYVDYLVKENILFEEAEKAHTFIKGKQLEQAQLAERRRTDEQIQKDRNDENYWGTVDSILSTKQLKVDGKEYTIPAVFQIKNGDKTTTATIDDFKAYLRQPLSIKLPNGKTTQMTKYEYDSAIREQENGVHLEIFDALALFTKNPTRFIQEQIRTAQAKEKRKLVSKVNDTQHQQRVNNTNEQIDYSS